MAEERAQSGLSISIPSRFLYRMAAFLLIIAIVAYALAKQIERFFSANPPLNALIIAVLFFGITYAFRQILVLRPAARWVNDVRRLDRGLLPPEATPPALLAPMASMLDRDWGQVSFATLAMRQILDSVGARLDETRDISRYMISLLIFLGLLGTFWGLLETIGAVSDTIGHISTASSSTADVIAHLMDGIRKPLSGMSTAFSASLFGLSGSLILGFLDLQASQCQNQFYNELEEWLTETTEITARLGGPKNPLPATSAAPAAAATSASLEAAIGDLKREVRDLSDTLRRITEGTAEANQVPPPDRERKG